MADESKMSADQLSAWTQAIAALKGYADKSNTQDMNNRTNALTSAELAKIPLPVLEKMVAEQLGRPEAATQDPAFAAAQRQALSQMQGYAKGEITDADRAQLSLAENEAAKRGQIQQNAITQQAQSQGQLGGGAQLAMQQMAAKGQSENAYNLGLQNMINQRSRQFGAIGQVGQMASAGSAQDFQRKSAADAVSAANARARAQAHGYNLGIPQRQYQNEMGKWAAQAGRSDQGAAQASANAHENAALIGTAGAGFGELASGYMKKNKDDEAEVKVDPVTGNPIYSV